MSSILCDILHPQLQAFNLSHVFWQPSAACHCVRREMQQHVSSLQAELRAAQAAADLEATLSEFRGYLENGESYHCLCAAC